MSASDRTVAIIPARYASTRLPGKPLADLCGKPLVQHVYERAARATSVHAVIVATDDERIMTAVQAFGGTAVMTPRDLHSGSDRIAYVARSLEDADIIVNVQGDEPLIEPEMIDEAVQPLRDSRDLVAATLVRPIESTDELMNPNVAKVALDGNSNCLYFSRSAIPFGRDLPPTDWLRHHRYWKHIGLYVFRRRFLLAFATMAPTPLEKAEKLEQLRILEHGYTLRAVITHYDSMPVDTPADLERVRVILQCP